MTEFYIGDQSDPAFYIKAKEWVILVVIAGYIVFPYLSGFIKAWIKDVRGKEGGLRPKTRHPVTGRKMGWVWDKEKETWRTTSNQKPVMPVKKAQSDEEKAVSYDEYTCTFNIPVPPPTTCSGKMEFSGPKLTLDDLKEIQDKVVVIQRLNNY